MLSSRVIDYFALVRCLAAPLFTTEVQLRFPLEDHADCDFPKDLHLFCFPTGDDIFLKPETIAREFSFLLTEIDGRRVYVSVIRFADANSDGSILCLTLTSHWPFYKQMLQFLRHLRLVLTNSEPPLAPIESILTNLIFEVPLPPRGRTKVIVPLTSMHLGSMELCFKRPPPNAGALIDYDFASLFYYFSLDNILTIFSAIFSERRIVFISNQESCLTTIMEAFNCIISPFMWRHAYIPLLPAFLVDYICAPMPFLMGVCRVYLPEKSALSGLVLADCDMNTVTFLDESANEMTSFPVPALPDRAGKQLLKRLRSLTSLPETNFVCPPDVSIDSECVKDYFLRFFAFIFAGFHSYFDDSKEHSFDKKAFLDNCSDRCEFVNQLLDTQMFASFLDDRIQFSDDLDILLFDEYIRREQGRPAAFLADTSQTHQSEYVCQPPLATGNVNYESGFPKSWDPAMLPVPRSIEALVDISTEFQKAMSSGMSYASLKFFMDKKIYSRKLNAISQQCARDDQMFLSIDKSMNEWTTLRRSSIATECKVRMSKMIEGDELVISGIWNQVCSYVESSQTVRQSEMKTMDSLNNDLSGRIHFLDREIRILFDESKQLDAEATSRKTELERIKLLLVNARQKLALIEQESKLPADLRKSVSLFRQSDLSRLVAARSDVQALSIEQSEAETSFWTHLDLYNSRIPQIIFELQRLSLCRVASLKSALQLLTSSRLDQLRKETLILNNLSIAISDIDVDETLLQEMFPDNPLQSELRLSTEIIRSVTPNSVISPCTKLLISEYKDSPIHSAQFAEFTQLFRYSILLWGNFDVVFQHAVNGKSIVKQVSLVVNGASSLFEFLSRNLGKLSKSSFPSRSLSTSRLLSPKLQTSSTRNTTRLSDAENAIDDQLNAFLSESSQLASQMSRKLQQLFVEIRVLKRECKGSFTIIQRRRNKLEADVQVANELYLKNGPATVPLTSNTSLMSKSQREIDMFSRQWETAQVQHQLGYAHLLDQFQRIEQLRVSALKKIITDVHAAFEDYCTRSIELQKRLLSAYQAVNLDAIISEYSHRFTNKQSNKEIFDCIGDGIEHVSSAITLMENLVRMDETLSSKLRKQAWNIDSQEFMPSISKALGSISLFFQCLPKALDKNVMIRRDEILELRRYRDQWQSKLSILTNKEQVENRNRDTTVSSYEHARSDLVKAMQNVSQNRERLAKAEAESSDADTSMKIMKFLKTPPDKQRVRLVESETELEAARTNCTRLELEKNNTEEKFPVTLQSIHSFTLDVEQARLTGLFAALKNFSQHAVKGNDIVADAVRSAMISAREVDVQSDMSIWVDSVRAKATYECPDIVLRNLERGIEDVEVQGHDRNEGSVAERKSAQHMRPIVETGSVAVSESCSPDQFQAHNDHAVYDGSLSDDFSEEGSKVGSNVIAIFDVAVQNPKNTKSNAMSDVSSISTLSD